MTGLQGTAANAAVSKTEQGADSQPTARSPQPPLTRARDSGLGQSGEQDRHAQASMECPVHLGDAQATKRPLAGNLAAK